MKIFKTHAKKGSPVSSGASSATRSSTPASALYADMEEGYLWGSKRSP